MKLLVNLIILVGIAYMINVFPSYTKNFDCLVFCESRLIESSKTLIEEKKEFILKEVHPTCTLKNHEFIQLQETDKTYRAIYEIKYHDIIEGDLLLEIGLVYDKKLNFKEYIVIKDNSKIPSIKGILDKAQSINSSSLSKIFSNF